MPIHKENFNVGELKGFSEDLDLVGLDIFKKKLEKHFFANINIRKCLTDSSNIELVIEIKCAIDLALAVQHFRIDVLSNSEINSNFLMNCLSELQELNTESIDIKELSFLMNDTSIFIQQVCEHGVVQQLDNIIRLVMSDYNYIVTRLKEVPSEIHIPVLEDASHENNSFVPLSDFAGRTTEKHYFTYWGLIFNSTHDTVIYDLGKSDFIFEEPNYLYG